MAADDSTKEESPTSIKRARLEFRKSRRPYFQRVHEQFVKHKPLVSGALEQLNSDWASFCFVNILNCNADESCFFSQAYCKTIRNVQDTNCDKQCVVLIPDLFNISLIQMFIEMSGNIENQLTENQLTAFERLAAFLDNISGNEKVWHGSVDIKIGPVAFAAPKLCIEEEVPDENNTGRELSRGLEHARHELVAESITFAFANGGRIVPLIGISKEDIKIFMYVPDEDILYESTELPLFENPLSGRQLHISSLVALWIMINYDCFCTGVKVSHVELDYKADFKKFLSDAQYDNYRHHIRMGGLKHVVSHRSEFKAGANMGKFQRI